MNYYIDARQVEFSTQCVENWHSVSAEMERGAFQIENFEKVPHCVAF